MNQQIKTGLGIIIILIFAVAAGVFVWLYAKNYVINYVTDSETSLNNGQKVCTQEAKVCPDGSAVGRTGPNCEFAECPAAKKETVSDFEECAKFYPVLESYPRLCKIPDGKTFVEIIMPQPDEAAYRCDKDSDCVSVQAECCGCAAGGSNIAINKKYLDSWNKKLLESVICKNVDCAQIISNHWTCFAAPKCINYKCQLSTFKFID